MLDLVIESRPRDLGGGLAVGRVLPFARRRMIGPFIFLDHMGPKLLRDYENMETVLPDGSKKPLVGPKGDLVILDLAVEGNYVAIRPSGTEPKIKLYMFTYEAPEQLANLDRAKEMLGERLDSMEADMRRFAGV